MQKFFHKLKDRTGREESECPDPCLPPSVRDIFCYRKQRGVNLAGSWFVLERWITDEPFNEAQAVSPSQSDLDVAKGNRAKEALERHWDTWINDEDWLEMSKRGINAVRIPIGYYHICGVDPVVLEGTDFQPFFEIYRGAWSRITHAIQTAANHGMGVLIDLHAAPGKQNNDSHAGTSDKANFFGDPHNQRCTVRALSSLLKHLNEFAKSCDPVLCNIIGIELLNEPNPPSDKSLQQWYLDAIKHLRAIDPTIPIYLGECWRTEAYAEWLAHHPSPLNALTVLDHHLYRCFTSSDTQTRAEDHARALVDPSAATPRILESVSEKVGRAGGGVVIGEWSGALNPASLRGGTDEQNNFIAAQLGLFERSCAGWFFWTYKKQWKGDTGWSWKDATERGVFPPFVGIKRHDVGSEDEERRKVAKNAAKDKALAAHTQYWSRHPGNYNHAFFEAGFVRGWDDAYAFFSSTPSTSVSVNQLGFARAWARRKAATTYDGKHYWEFETGFLQAVDEAASDYKSHV
ncbi:glycoside hydrolase family 5 protein [Gymnopilus junonius]|uniref:Glycoside hydrolase family 5 protein n=1 Tax=Gymnopilus junonius TaxID=109634 RepID=A0A9P5N8B3_GYMJU|nr:glycoside hydrolase family 5 protein [Gymnopilus junonius]